MAITLKNIDLDKVKRIKVEIGKCSIDELTEIRTFVDWCLDFSWQQHCIKVQSKKELI